MSDDALVLEHDKCLVLGAILKQHPNCSPDEILRLCGGGGGGGDRKRRRPSKNTAADAYSILSSQLTDQLQHQRTRCDFPLNKIKTLPPLCYLQAHFVICAVPDHAVIALPVQV